MNIDAIKSRSKEVYSLLNWNLTVEEINQTADLIIDGLKEKLDLLAKSEDKSFKATCVKLENTIEDTAAVRSNIYFLSQVSTDASIRDASNEASKKIQKFLIDISMRDDIYQLLKDCKALNEDLDEIDSKLLERYLRDFRRNGLDLDVSIQSEYKEIQHNISQISLDGQKIINDIQPSLVFSAVELEGVPETVVSKLKMEDGKYHVGTIYPEYLPVMEYAKNPLTRRKLEELYKNRTVAEGNVERLEELISLRARAAHLLGYETHADYALEIKTAKKKEIVFDFLNDLEQKLKPHGRDDVAKIIELKKVEENDSAIDEVVMEDYRYYTRLVTEKNYNIDKEEIKQYFPMKETVDGMLNFYQKVFGLTFTKLEDVPTWHEEALYFAVTDEEDKFRGIFALDLFPRDGKYGHAAAFNLIDGRNLTDGYQGTYAVMLCNFDKPTKDHPSLLNHQEVETLYHEFGHIVHEVVTSARYARLTISGVSWDFVEAPSQIFENWVWEPSILKSITQHYQTGERIPDTLIDKLVRSRYALASIYNLRQIFIGKFDMTIHTQDEIDGAKIWHEMRKEVTLFPEIPNSSPFASFGHFFGGYDAGYYGYLWSKVLAQDMYTKFQEIGIDSPKVGIAYRKMVLEPGAQKDEIEMVEEFLGRKVDNSAFLTSLGL